MVKQSKWQNYHNGGTVIWRLGLREAQGTGYHAEMARTVASKMAWRSEPPLAIRNWCSARCPASIASVVPFIALNRFFARDHMPSTPLVQTPLIGSTKLRLWLTVAWRKSGRAVILP